MQNNNLFEVKLAVKKLFKDKRQNRITMLFGKSSVQHPRLNFFVLIKPKILISKAFYLVKIICSYIYQYEQLLIKTENTDNELNISVGRQLWS